MAHFFRFILTLITLCLLPLLGLNSCGTGTGPTPPPVDTEGVVGPPVTGDPGSFRGAGVILDPKYLIGGPLAQGRTGDVLIQNEKARFLIQKPRRNAGVALYGGNIIDADQTRITGEAGRDQFGILFPLINISWTPFYRLVEIVNSDFANGPVIVRATGVLDVYDYIQTSIISPFARIAKGVELFFPNQYNDVLNPFENLPELRPFSTTIVTEYILEPGKPYLKIQTHLYNNGEDPISMPIGEWVNSSGTLETFLPGEGFTGVGLFGGQLSAGVPGVVYPGLETTTGISYGFFYDPTPFLAEDGTIQPSDLLTVSGVSILSFGERIAPGLFPLSSDNPPDIHFAVPPGETIITRYFAVGNGDIASVLGGAFDALGIETTPIAGQVVDANGAAVPNARVLVVDTGIKRTVSMFYSDTNGNFSGVLSKASDAKGKMFGEGAYQVEVYKEGYLDPANTWKDTDSPSPSLVDATNPKSKAGACDLSAGLTQVHCTLGQFGFVEVTAKDTNGQKVPARIAIVGFDPSPFQKLPDGANPGNDDGFSGITDIEFQSQQYGYIDTLFLNPNGEITNTGNPRVVGQNRFRLEPGNYMIFLLRGPEYSMHSEPITVTDGGIVSVNGTINKVVNTQGYISADFHIHGINSPDSPFGQEARVHFALAEGLDLMVSADHDAVTDYSIAIHKLGVQNYVTSITGDEITPMAYGHFIVFPILFDANNPTGGAFDYTKKAGFEPGPNHHEVLSPEETLMAIEALNPGEQVLQVNHIMDNILGNFALSRLVTTTKFDGVPPLSMYGDPVTFRLDPNTNEAGGYKPPFPFGTSSLYTNKFTALEICIGESSVVPLPHIVDTALPTWFNLLNLGKFATATCSSDTHRQIREPIGILRNYVASSVDPRDGIGSFSAISPEEIAHNVNRHHLIVSAGPFMTVTATSPQAGKSANVGDLMTLSGGAQDIDLEIHIESPSWMDWDVVEIYVNTDPIPAKDDLSGPWDGTPEEFVTATQGHLDPKYSYSPVANWKRNGIGGDPFAQTIVPNETRSVTLQKTLSLTQDSWIVVMVKGSDDADTLFPYGPKAVNVSGPDVSPANFLTTLADERTVEGQPSKIGGSKAFAFTNPIFIDIDGDGFKAKYVLEGKSPLPQQ